MSVKSSSLADCLEKRMAAVFQRELDILSIMSLFLTRPRAINCEQCKQFGEWHGEKCPGCAGTTVQPIPFSELE